MIWESGKLYKDLIAKDDDGKEFNSQNYLIYLKASMFLFMTGRKAMKEMS